MDDMDDLKVIVETLNAPPFHKGLTLVAFHNKSPLELLQTCNDIFAVMDPSMEKDIREDQQEALCQRMLEFVLGTLGYKPPSGDIAEFSSNFIKADTECIYPLIYWMLEQMDVLKKRAYLARFLKTVEVPEEMFADANIVQLYQEYKTLQDQFKEIHMVVDKERTHSLNPLELENEIEQLTQEKEQLTTKLGKLKDKIDNGAEFQDVNFQEILEATNSLRKEQEEESKLYQSLQEEKQKLTKNERVYQHTKSKLRNLEESDIARKNPRQLLEDLRDEVKKMRLKNNQTLSKDIENRVKMLSELEEVISSEPLSMDQVADLEAENAHYNQECEALISRLNAMQSSADGKISFYRSRVITAEKKRDELDETISELRDEEKDLENDLRQLDADLKTLVANGEKPKTDAQMRAYMKELTAKTTVYKAKKAELQAAKDEVRVLMETENTLRSRADNIQEFNDQLAKEHGVEGFQDVQDNMEHVSMQNQSIDNSKGQKLDELSKVIATITGTLKAKKDKLQPQIKELRSIRNEYEQVQAVFDEKFKAYEAIRLSIDSDRARLEEEVDANMQAITDEENSYHYLNCLRSLNEAKKDQMSQELAFLVGEERLNPQYKSYKEMLEKLISAEETKSKRLRQTKATVQEGHSGNIEQRNLFLNLRTIMQCKMKMQTEKLKQEQAEEESLVFGGGAERMDFS